MGASFLGTAYSEIVAVELAKLSAMDTHGGEVANVGEALTKYQDLFVLSAEIGIASAIIFLIISPLLKKMMHGVD